MMDFFGWAKRPMIERMKEEMSPSLGVTMIYGGNTWLQQVPEEELKAVRPSQAKTAVHVS
jgi:hypothetical protein